MCVCMVYTCLLYIDMDSYSVADSSKYVGMDYHLQVYYEI